MGRLPSTNRCRISSIVYHQGNQENWSNIIGISWTLGYNEHKDIWVCPKWGIPPNGPCFCRESDDEASNFWGTLKFQTSSMQPHVDKIEGGCNTGGCCKKKPRCQQQLYIAFWCRTLSLEQSIISCSIIHLPGLVNIQKTIEHGHRNSWFTQ